MGLSYVSSPAEVVSVSDILKSNCVGITSTFVISSNLAAMDFCSFDENLLALQDWDFLISIFLSGVKSVYYDAALTNYIISLSNASNISKSLDRHRVSFSVISSKYEGILETYDASFIRERDYLNVRTLLFKSLVSGRRLHCFTILADYYNLLTVFGLVRLALFPMLGLRVLICMRGFKW